MECVCGICFHWEEEQCRKDECECCIELHEKFSSDKKMVVS